MSIRLKKRQKSKKGFSLIELIVVIAIVGIMVMIAAPKFLGYTKDAEVAVMKSDAKILTDAAMLYSIEHNSAWPIGEEIVKSAELEAVIGEVAVYEIDEIALAPYVKNIEGEYADYGIIATGELEGEIVSLLGVTAMDETVWFNQSFSVETLGDEPILPDEPDEPEIYLATDDDFNGVANGSFVYIGTATEVKIPHVIKGVPVTSYASMFNFISGSTAHVTKVVSDNPNITTTNYMFRESKATTLDLSEFDTSNVTNMSFMFYQSEATTLNLSGWNTSLLTNMSSMFRNSKATSLDLSNFDTSNVTNMSWTFASSLATDLNVASLNTAKVTNMSQLFSFANATSLNLSNWDTSMLTAMDNAFEGFKGTTLNLDNWNITKIGNLGNLFKDSLATTISMAGWNTSNVSIMSSMFENSQVTSIDLSGFNTSKVHSMTRMFASSKITTLDLRYFDVSALNNMDNMFLSSIATTGHARTSVDAAKLNASLNKPIGLTFVDVYGSDVYLATDDDFSGTTNGTFRYTGTATQVEIPNVIKGVSVTSYANMFQSTNVVKVVSNNPNITNMSYMFYQSNAKTIDLTYLDTSNVTDMSWMFSYSKVRDFNVSSLNTIKVTNMSWMFSGMFILSPITSFDLSAFNTANVTNMSSMFFQIAASSLDLSGLDTTKVINTTNMFATSSATTGYARTAADAAKLNASSNKPAGLTFIVP